MTNALSARPLAVGERVQHFTNPQCKGVVVRVTPKQPCGEYGLGNRLRGAWAPQDVVLVEITGTSVRAESFASSWQRIEEAL